MLNADLSTHNSQYKMYQIPTIIVWVNTTGEMYKKKKYNGHLRMSMHMVEHNQMAI